MYIPKKACIEGPGKHPQLALLELGKVEMLMFKSLSCTCAALVRWISDSHRLPGPQKDTGRCSKKCSTGVARLSWQFREEVRGRGHFLSV